MKKKIIIAAISAITIAGSAIIYLSETVFKYNHISKAYININDHIEAYPYYDPETPENFKEYSVKGFEFKAPDNIFRKYPEATKGLKEGIFVDNDSDSYSLKIAFLDGDVPEYPAGFDLGENGFFSGSIKKGMDKLSYKVPENFHDLLYLLGTIKLDDCNKYSPLEVRTFQKLAEYKEIMTPSYIDMENDSYGDKETNRYFYDTDKCKFLISEHHLNNGRYKLLLDCYKNNDLDHYQTIYICGENSKIVKQIAQTVTITEE